MGFSQVLFHFSLEFSRAEDKFNKNSERIMWWNIFSVIEKKVEISKTKHTHTHTHTYSQVEQVKGG